MVFVPSRPGGTVRPEFGPPASSGSGSWFKNLAPEAKRPRLGGIVPKPSDLVRGWQPSAPSAQTEVAQNLDDDDDAWGSWSADAAGKEENEDLVEEGEQGQSWGWSGGSWGRRWQDSEVKQEWSWYSRDTAKEEQEVEVEEEMEQCGAKEEIEAEDEVVEEVEEVQEDWEGDALPVANVSAADEKSLPLEPPDPHEVEPGMGVEYDNGASRGWIENAFPDMDEFWVCNAETKEAVLTSDGSVRVFRYADLVFTGARAEDEENAEAEDHTQEVRPEVSQKILDAIVRKKDLPVAQTVSMDATVSMAGEAGPDGLTASDSAAPVTPDASTLRKKKEKPKVLTAYERGYQDGKRIRAERRAARRLKRAAEEEIRKAQEARAAAEEERKKALETRRKMQAIAEKSTLGAVAVTPTPTAEAVKSTTASSDAPKTVDEWANAQDQFAHLPKLQDNWIRVKSKDGRTIYYVNRESGKTTSTEPRATPEPDASAKDTKADGTTVSSATAPGLPEGWEQIISKSSGKVYYFHRSTGTSQFEIPRE